MAEWVWSISYEHGDPRIILADRSTRDGIRYAIGAAALETSARSWPWWLGLGSALYRLGVRLTFAARRNQRTVAEIPADDAVISELQRLGLIDETPEASE